MTTVTCDLSVSVDGYSAGAHQMEERAEIDRINAAQAFSMGRNMFEQVRSRAASSVTHLTHRVLTTETGRLGW